MTDIFTEVDEDIRKERYLHLWKKYGPWAIALAVLLVASVAGWQGWQAYQQSQAEQASERYIEAARAIDEGERGAALSTLDEIARPNASDTTLLAAFRQAELMAQEGETGEAVAIWERIAESSGPPPQFRSLATIYAVMHQVEEGNPQALSERLEPLAQSDDPFRHTALELQALLAQKQGDDSRAAELYGRVVEGSGVPAAQRQRAEQMRALLEG